MYILKCGSTFKKWLDAIDKFAAVVVLTRLRTVSKGSLGTWRSVGGGVSELKIDFGPGYRVYFTRRGKEVIILLVGGDKKSQKRDIAKAQELAKLPTIDCEDLFEEDENENSQS